MIHCAGPRWGYYTTQLSSLWISPPVLVPGLDLSVRQAQLGRQLHPVLDREVLLPLEAGLQGLELVVREGSPGLPLLLGVAGGVRAVSEILLSCKY